MERSIKCSQQPVFSQQHGDVTAEAVQHPRQLEILRHFQAQGCLTVVGGSYASLCPEAFEGKAYFVDVFSNTIESNGELVQTMRLPKTLDEAKARAKDNVHLTKTGVRWLMVEPILKILEPCVGASGC